MTSFVESCVETVAGSAQQVERRARRHPRAKKLLRLLSAKRNILITSHIHPDPDALASALGMAHLLRSLIGAKVSLSFKGRLGGGINEGFVKLSNLNAEPWDDARLGEYDAIVLMDCQPLFAYSPLPAGMMPTSVIDHHRAPGKFPKCEFCDIRTDVGASSSIVFSYFMELEIPIPRDLAAILLFAIESDLAGAAGTPGELDNIALSSLTLIADTRKLYQMRYAPLPHSYFTMYHNAIRHAFQYDRAMMSHLDSIESLEQPALAADFLLRREGIEWSLVTAVHENRLVVSLRTNSPRLLASDIARRLLRNIGQGGGHRTKAGGYVALDSGSPTEIERKRNVLRRRYLRALGIKQTRGIKLVHE